MKYLLLLLCSLTFIACSDDDSKRGNGAAARGPRQFEAIAGSCGGGATAGSCGQGSFTTSGSCPLTASVQALAATSTSDRVVVQLSLEGCPACVTKKAELEALADGSASSFTELKLDGDDPHTSRMAFPQVLVVEGGSARLAPAELSSLF